MYHSVTFDSQYNTYETWHLIPKERPFFETPDLEYLNEVQLPFSSISVRNRPRGFNIKRKASWSFYVMNDYTNYNWATLYSDIQNKLHGKSCLIELEDEPGIYYYGMVKVLPWENGDNWSTVKIEVEAEPFKTSNPITVEVRTNGYTFWSNTEFVSPSIVKIHNPNNARGKVTVTGVARDKFTGTDEPITVTDMEMNSVIVIDGLDKRVYRSSNTSENAMRLVDMWAFPSVIPGNNLIGLNDTSGIGAWIEIIYSNITL